MKAESDPSRCVVVTGMGVVSSIGTGRAAFWRRLLEGRSGIGPVTTFDTAAHPVSIGGEIRDFDPLRHLRSETASSCGRGAQLAMAASALALEDAGLAPSVLKAERPGIYVGTTMGEGQVHEAMVAAHQRSGGRRFDSADLFRAAHSLLAINVAREWGLKADCLVFSNACAAGNYALGHAFDRIRAGRVDVALAGGSDAFSQIAYTGFGRMLLLAPEKCQPFDKNRKGIVIGEGAGMLALESLEHARARDARIHACLLGYALSCDAHHMTIPRREALVEIMQCALRNCGIGPEDVDLISAHGTGTPANDQTEAAAIGEVFGERAARLPVNSIKSMLGHTMGAASALEAISCVMSVAEGRIAPTINFETPDPRCPVDCVPNRMREARVKIAMNNSYAFGGNNAVTVFGRAE